MEEIMQAVAKAEAEAARIRERALASAREIAASSEEQAARIRSVSAAKIKNARESGLRAAEAQAQGEYAAAIEESTREAVEYADECMNRTDRAVTEIVRRICSGC